MRCQRLSQACPVSYGPKDEKRKDESQSKERPTKIGKTHDEPAQADGAKETTQRDRRQAASSATGAQERNNAQGSPGAQK